jgi:YYY domain-containing protein
MQPPRVRIPLPARQRWPALAAVALVALALVLRLQGLDWDGGHLLHPDERSIYLRAEQMYDTLTDAPNWRGDANRDFPADTPGWPSPATFLDPDASPLNPHWFPLGSVLIYVLVGVRFVLEALMDQVRLQDLATAGRALAACADAGTVGLLFLLGRRLFGTRAGLLAAGLGALSVGAIQLAHVYRPEPFVVPLALGLFWWLLSLSERGGRREHLMVGLFVGLSFALRGSSLPLLAPVALVYAALVAREPARWARVVGEGVRAGAVALGVFALLQPYALLDLDKYLGDLGWEAMIARTAGLVPYTLQYVGTPRWGSYEVSQSAVWALGLPLGIVAWGGLAASVVAGLRRPRLREWVVLAWVLAVLVTIVPTFEVKFLRYVAPVLPVLVLLGARWLLIAHAWARARWPVLGRAVAGLGVFVVASTALYALAFTAAYATPHPAVQASTWLREQVDAGALILTDNHWDEGIPGLWGYRVEQLPAYESDTAAKTARYAGLLAEAEVLVAYSNRPWGSISRVPERYPVTAGYYHALFEGRLGYTLEAAFARYPALAGVAFTHDPFTRAGVAAPASLPGLDPPVALRLGWADENVTNYDRPLVLVWRNTGRLSAAQVTDVLSAGAVAVREPLQMSEDAWARQQASGSWDALFSPGGLNGAAPWLLWLLVVELAGLAALPLALWLARPVPGLGPFIARPLGLLGAAWVAWWGASAGVWDFGRGSVLAGMVLMGALSAALVWPRRARLRALVRAHVRAVAWAGALFLGVFVLFALIRAANPDLWHPWRGGEKPMDLAYLTAVMRSVRFPAYDPWYAGGQLNYYYFGFVLVGSVARVAGTVPAVAYNLGVATLAALTLTGAFGVGMGLSNAWRVRARLVVGARSTLAAGALAALLVGVVGNLDGVAQLAQGLGRVINGQAFGGYDYWRSSRLMPGEWAINEFPFWTFLFGDLHAHLMALPVQVLTVGLASAVALSAGGSWRALAPRVAALAVAVGSLAAINTWDVPAYGLLALGAVAVAVALGHRGPVRPMTAVRWGAWLAGLWALGYLAWAPFHLHYETPSGGAEPSAWRTVTWQYVAIHAVVAFGALSWLAAVSWRTEVRRRVLTRLAARRAAAGGMGAVLVLVTLWVAAPPLREWTTFGLLALALGAVLAQVGLWAARRPTEPEAPVRLLVLGMLALAMGIGAGVDLVRVTPDIDRMNTLFKLGLNAWVLYGLVGGVGLWHLWATGALRRRSGPVGSLRNAWVVLALVLAGAGLVYPAWGTLARVDDRFDTTVGLTLDGEAYLRTAVYGDPGPADTQDDDVRYPLAHDAEALAFLREHAEGTPVVLEAAYRHGYRWYPRVAAYTGLPVVVGWEWHQLQQRGDGGNLTRFVRSRLTDVETAYRTPAEESLRTVLARYGVDYIYLGPTERAYFPGAGIAKFEALVGRGLEVFFTNGQVTIYRVEQAWREESDDV